MSTTAAVVQDRTLSPHPDTIPIEETPVSDQVTPTKVYSSEKTAALASQSTSSLGGSKPIPSNRQSDFEKLFGPHLQPHQGEDTPDFFTVCQTQSADLQASVLLHGRLYLTRYHICFRSNICGYVTEKIHDLRHIVSIERSTTAKWIQNAISITLDTDSDEKVVGYGSMADRDAMYAGVMEVWKLRAPERWNSWVERQAAKGDGDADLGQDSAIVGDSKMSKSKRNRSATTTTQSGTNKYADVESRHRHRAVTAAGELGHGQDGSPKKAVGHIPEEQEHEGLQETECSGEHYDELALDTTVGVKMEQLYNLMYHTPEFGKVFFEEKQKLTDLDVGDWEEKDGAKERSLKYVMHMNNYIGPKKSDCIGYERVEIADAAKAYEIVSETQTPDVPSGKSFKIHTRTCLTIAIVDGAPATRMYCTTQCDWSASSMLKSTITPAVIKGQKEYHQNWLAALKEWIEDHPEDFESSPDSKDPSRPKPKSKLSTRSVLSTRGAETRTKEKRPSLTDLKGGSSTAPIDPEVVPRATLAHQVTEIANNQIMMSIMIVCALSLALNLYLLRT